MLGCTYNRQDPRTKNKASDGGGMVCIKTRVLAFPLYGMILCLCISVYAATAAADQFSFSADTAKEQEKADADAAARAQSIQALVSVPCRQRLKDQRIVLLMAEQTPRRWLAAQDRYGQFVRILDTRLKGLGLKTYTEQQIKAGIAQAEIDAYFKNDPDAALSASKRLGANYILKGSISSRTGTNPVVGVKEVDVNIDLTLSAADGRVLSDVSAHSGSYSGSDTLGTALDLVKEQADTLVAQLYNDYCHDGTK
jgi:nucleotide-binding universal stress UspA family protein